LEQAFGLPALPSAFAIPDGRYVGEVKIAAVPNALAEGLCPEHMDAIEAFCRAEG
jgi:hypothetical protein